MVGESNPAPVRSAKPAATGRRRSWIGWTAVSAAVLALILVPFMFFERGLADWADAQLRAGRGWSLGLLIAGLLASDTLLPVPSSLVATSAGLLLGFGGGLAASSLGMAVGALLGYGLGAMAGEGLLRKVVGAQDLERARTLSEKYGAVALVLSRPVPVLAEASVIYAGLTKMPWLKFLAVTTLANLGVSAVYAAVGALAYSGSSFLLAFLGALGVPAAAVGLYRVLAKRTK